MLDPLGKRKVLNIINAVQKERKKTLISITHDMDEAILADYCLVFSEGKIIGLLVPLSEILNNKEILSLAKIDSPFIYKLSEKINGVKPTYHEQELLDQICK